MPELFVMFVYCYVVSSRLDYVTHVVVGSFLRRRQVLGGTRSELPGTSLVVLLRIENAFFRRELNVKNKMASMTRTFHACSIRLFGIGSIK